MVIPVHRDTESLRRLLTALAREPHLDIVVVSGGSPEAGLMVLRERTPGVEWRAGPVCRGEQLNRGAARARGDWLLFLHADTCPDPGWAQDIRALTGERAIVGGSLRFTLESDAPQARLIAWGVRQRVRWFNLPYGDQGLFVRRHVFEEMGGYKPIPLMEDVDFVRRLGRRGRLRHLARPIRISARRWQRDGWCRRSIGNVSLLALYGAGVSPERLARIYYAPRGGDGAADAAGGAADESPVES